MVDLIAARAILSSSSVIPALTKLLEVPPNSFSWQICQIHTRPGIDLSIIYRIQLSPTQINYVVLSTSTRPKYAHLNIDDLAVIGWVHPFDPNLPGLNDASRASQVSDWLGWPEAQISIRSYRPMKRAVLEARHLDRKVFLKVVNPIQAHQLIEKHHHLNEVGPKFLGQPAPGVLILSQVPGLPLSKVLAASKSPSQAPKPQTLLALLHRLPTSIMELPSYPAWSDQLSFYAAGARYQLPQQQEAVDHTMQVLNALLHQTPRGPIIPTHGDFYETNIFVENHIPRWLIDVDSVGPGYLVDELACLLGHMAVLPDLSPKHYYGIPTILNYWLRSFNSFVDPVALSSRIAAVILSLVNGAEPPHDQHRFNLVNTWLRRAEAASNADLR